MTAKIKLLLVESKDNDFRLIEANLSDSKQISFHIEKATSLAAAIAFLKKNTLDVILLDLYLSDSEGLDTFRAINQCAASSPIIVLTGSADEQIALDAIKEGAQDYIIKDLINSVGLVRSILYAIERQRIFILAELYSSIVESAEEAVYSKDMQGIVTSWNPAAERIYGYSAAEMVGSNISLIIPENKKNELNLIIDSVKAGIKVSDFETERKRKDNQIISVSITASGIKDRLGNVIGVSIIAHDISERKKLERQLGIQYRVALILAEGTNLKIVGNSILKTICEIMEWNFGEIWLVNSSTNTINFLTGWPASFESKLIELSHKKLLEFGENIPGYVVKSKEYYWNPDLSKQSAMTIELPELMKELKCCLAIPIIFENEVLSVLVFYDKNMTAPTRSLISVFEIIGTQIGRYIKYKGAEGDLLFLARHDVLTGVLNRHAFEEEVNKAIHVSKRYQRRLAILYFDIDYFKKVNDALGHKSGDQLLIQVADRLQKTIRASDILARFGGDEFIILLPEISDVNDIKRIADKILKAVMLPFSLGGREIFITASIGISIYPDDGTNSQDLLSNADIAMYRAKNHGRNNFQLAVPGMISLSQERVFLEKELHHALTHGEFILYYQPIVDISSNSIVSVEALLRWKLANGKILPPKEFLSVAEEMNLIIPLGEMVLKDACHQLKQW